MEPGVRTAFPDTWPELALGGGEDFELLVAAPAAQVEQLVAGWPDALAPLTLVGRLVAGSGLSLLDREGGSAVEPPAIRSRHFA